MMNYDTIPSTSTNTTTDDSRSPLFSVVTVVFNAVDTIQETVESVLNQTWTDFEYIVIDGGSTDGTVEILEKYKNHFTCFQSESDNGVYDGLNKAICVAHGIYVAIVHAGDRLLPNGLQIAQRQIASYNEPVDILAMSSFQLIGNETQLVTRDSLPPLGVEFQTIHHPALLIGRSLFNRYGLYDTSFPISADYEFVSRIISRGSVTIAYSNEPFVDMAKFGLSGNKENLLQKSKDHIRVLRRYSGVVACMRYIVMRTLRYSFAAVRKSVRNIVPNN